MILKAKHHPVIFPFFRLYTLCLLKKHFSGIRIAGHYVNEKQPVLLIANHFSWWDGLIALYLNMKLFKKRFYFMMLEEQLHRYWYFNYCGGFSVKRKSRSVLETIQYTNELLTDKSNLVLIFPQGEIQSMHKQDFIFEKGIERILQNMQNKIQVVFIANLVDYLSNKKPRISIYYSIQKDLPADINSIQEKYTNFYSQSVAQQIEIKE